MADLLQGAHPGLTVELEVVETSGDRRQDVPVWEMGGQGVFVKEVQAAVLDGRADLAVHSAKDLPSTTAAGLVLACIPEREDPSDALVGARLAELPAGALIATGSVRRRAQLAWLRPDLTFTGLRGNITTRLAKASPEQVVVVATAALRRLDQLERASEILDPAVMVPQVGQGALAVECRADDEAVRDLLAAIDDRRAHRAVDAERGFLARLGGGCDLPAGALAVVGEGGRDIGDSGDGGAGGAGGAGGGRSVTVDGGDRSVTVEGMLAITVEGMLASADGHILLRAQRVGEAGSGEEAASIGARLAEYLLDEAGGAELLGDRYLAQP